MTRPTNIIRRQHSRHYTVLTNAVPDDARLSLDELGFLTWLLSRPHDWEVIPAACRKRFKIGRDKFYRIVKALVRTGYASRDKVRADDGTIVCVRYIITDDPGPEQVIDEDIDIEEPDATDIAPAVTSLQQPENPDTAEPDTGFEDSGLSKKKLINNPPTPQEPKPTEQPQEAAEQGKGEAIPPNRGQPKFSILKLNWPADHVLSATAAERKFLRLKEPEQWAAIDRAPAYIADIRSRGWKLGDLTTYLREKRWERLASPTPTASWATRGGTPRAFRWLEYREAMGEPTAYMRDCFATGKPWYAPSEWPPALPKRESTGPPPSLMTPADHEELTRGI